MGGGCPGDTEPPFLCTKKIHCNGMSTVDEDIAKKQHKVKVEFFSSSPTLSYSYS